MNVLPVLNKYFSKKRLILLLQVLSLLLSVNAYGRQPSPLEIKLKVAPGSITSNTTIIVWGEGDPLPYGQFYTVYQNGKAIDTTDKCYYQIKNLSPDILYDFHVSLNKHNGKIIRQSDLMRARTKLLADTIVVTDFGAVGDGKTVNTDYLQQAINKCPYDGVVVVPKGVYLTGALFVKSNMTLYLEEKAVLRAVVDIREFPIVEGNFEGVEGKQFASLINGGELCGRGIQDFSIRGKGVIDAEGGKLIKLEEDDSEAASQGKRGRIISINNGENIYFEGVSFLESPAWGVHFVYCHGVTVNDIYVNTNYDPETGEKYVVHNGDGITLSSAKNVYILNARIASQDDNISIKSGRNQDGWRVAKSIEHVRIYNCTFSDGFGLVLGSEMSGNIRDIIVNNCMFENTAQIAQIKTRFPRGRTIENVVFKNIVHTDNTHTDSKWFRGGICIDEYYGREPQDYTVIFPVDERMPTIQDIWFENIKMYRKKGRSIYLCGRPERYLKNINFKNMEITAPFGLEARFVDGIKLEKVTLNVPDGEEPYQWDKVERLTFN